MNITETRVVGDLSVTRTIETDGSEINIVSTMLAIVSTWLSGTKTT